jgi:hypothetical protein
VREAQGYLFRMVPLQSFGQRKASMLPPTFGYGLLRKMRTPGAAPAGNDGTAAGAARRDTA